MSPSRIDNALVEMRGHSSGRILLLLIFGNKIRKKKRERIGDLAGNAVFIKVTGYRAITPRIPNIIRSWSAPLHLQTIISFRVPRALFHKRLCTRAVRATQFAMRERERRRRLGDYYRVNERAVIGCGEPPAPSSHRHTPIVRHASPALGTDRHVQFESQRE